ncbi:hypothetical protein [Arthrobacter sp. UYEF20]|uniref:hypothetical protein n=1 Tax=Arthrobacter sp. UYEF20 TaxID=1756363 RepID=UPI0033975FA2
MRPEARMEETYRAAVRASYPRQWRAESGEELIGVFLEVAAAEQRSRATVLDLANILVSGTAARLLLIVGKVGPRARDRVSTLATMLGTSMAVLMLLLGEWGPWVRAGSLRWRPTEAGFSERLVELGPFVTLSAATYIVWIAVFVATVLQRSAARRQLLILAVLTSILLPLSSWIGGVMAPPPVVSVAMVLAAVLALAGNATRTVHQLRLGRWGTPLLTAGLLAVTVFQLPGQAIFFYNARSVVAVDSHSISYAVGLALILGTAALTAPAICRHWAVALSILALPLMAQFFLPRILSAQDLRTLTIAVLVTAPIAALWMRWHHRRTVAPALQPA